MTLLRFLAAAKRAAAFRAVDENLSAASRIVGIGSGSTVVFAVERIAQRFHEESLPIVACIPTSFQAQSLILDAKLPLGTLNQFPEIDITFDGADEIDTSLNCIKGGGACHLQEKLVASNSKVFIVIADDRKDSIALGTKWVQGVPIEVIPTAHVAITSHIRSIGGTPTLRMAVKKAGPVVTDNGNFVIDAVFGEIPCPRDLHDKLVGIPGVVETGLFCGMAHAAYFGMNDGSVKVVHAPSRQ